MNKWLCLYVFARFLPALLIGLLALPACDRGSPVQDYKTLTVSNYIASFCCEYRAYYDDLDGPSIVESAAHRFTYVDILAPKKRVTTSDPEPGGEGNVKMEYIPAVIGIVAADATRYPGRPASSRIENSLADWGAWPNFKLVERSTVTVAGVEAELIVFEVDGFFVGPPIKYNLQVSFDHNGLLWDIEAECDLDMSEIVRADFDHVLETFRIFE